MTDLQQILKAVREEIRECGLTSAPLPALPPPSDVEAERVLLGALLCSEVPIPELPAGAFYLALHNWLFDKIEAVSAAGLVLRTELLAAAAGEDGMPVERVAEEIHHLTLRPICTPEVSAAAVVKIIRAHEARQLVAQLDQMRFALLTGARTPEHVRRHMGKLAGG